MYPLSVYDEKFYEMNQREGLAMAEWLCPAVIEIFNLKEKTGSIVDVGAGTGHLVKQFRNMDFICNGLEGSEYAVCHSLTDIYLVDLRTALAVSLKYDLAISLEVAEHIDPEFVDVYVDNLCALSDTILISAAVPNQGGEHHVNEQPFWYWLEKFEKRGYKLDEEAVAKFRMSMRIAKANNYFVPGYMHVTNYFVFRKA